MGFVKGADEDACYGDVAVCFWCECVISGFPSFDLPTYPLLPPVELLVCSRFSSAPDVFSAEVSSFERVNVCYGADSGGCGSCDCSGVGVAARAGADDEKRWRGGGGRD